METQKITIAMTKALHCTVSCTRLIQSTHTHLQGQF